MHPGETRPTHTVTLRCVALVAGPDMSRPTSIDWYPMSVWSSDMMRGSHDAALLFRCGWLSASSLTGTLVFRLTPDLWLDLHHHHKAFMFCGINIAWQHVQWHQHLTKFVASNFLASTIHGIIHRAWRVSRSWLPLTPQKRWNRRSE